MAANAHRMIGSGSNLAQVQRELIAAARRIAEARAATRAKGRAAGRAEPDNTANWRSARWLWPLL
jgi:hypothetical protein